MAKNTKLQFSLQHIKTEQFAMFEEIFNAKKTVEFNTGIEFKLETSCRLIAAFAKVSFEHGNQVFLKIEASCHFIINQDSWDGLMNKDKTITIPKTFLRHIGLMTIGTTRGILFAKTENTSLSKFIIPPINVEEIIEKDAVFSFEKINA